MASAVQKALILVLLLGVPTACSSDKDSGTDLGLKGPIDRGGGKLALELGSTYFEVTPEHGARITSLRQGDVELLFLAGAANYDDAMGSTFWPSPQTWGWPPPTEIDLAGYVADVDRAGIVTAHGEANPLTSLQVTKRFSANMAREAIEIEYSMTNTGVVAAQWAPWEVTRLPATGLAFWPTGGEPFGDAPLTSQAVDGHTWVAPEQTEGEGKLFADGAGGYLAYVLGDRLLVKQFEDQPPSAAAPNEAELELYVNADHDYIELETQGAYTSLEPGETLSWKVTWYARQLPARLTASVGDSELTAFVLKTLQ